ncbi:MAG: peptidylprolyl isomerase [Cellvibrionales bacterium]|jgi:FKBP-type peptidyl-prolyl cis-trans isomerase SlpA|nr:peptidylprolyl isomerase [Cellvibrionales bacterium]MBT5922202.1 peptidylprolyl isomerase [Cellvibrionales bacterium]MBT6580032.1 peptidylprolyl isomerase [Cellvibrionales bacterium]
MSDNSIAIKENTRVTLNFSLKLASGDVIDSNFDKPPVSFTVGDGNLLEGFEKSLFGMVAGEKSSCVIAAEFAFGVGNPDNIQRFRRHEIESMLEGGDATLEPGLVLSFTDAAKGELAGVVDSVETEAVFVNFNHPLADKDITFDVHIVEVVPA